MFRRDFIKFTSLGAASLFLPPQLIPALNISKVGAFTPLRKNVGFYTDRGGTIGWMVNDEGVVVIDAQFPESAENLIGEIRKQTDQKVNFLINTHHHGDHTGGNIAFKEMTEHVFAHENSKANQMRVAKERGNEEGQLYPDMTFEEEWSNQIGDETITCSYHGRGHTNGDIITHFENANIVHMGDLVFNRRFPYIDKSAGAHIGNWIHILDHTVKRFDEDTIFIFGHSGEGFEITGSIEDVKAFTNYLEQLMLEVEKGIEAGKSLQDLKKEMTVVKGAPQWSGNGIERSLDAAYMELTEGE
ncbi:MBL fold metallo-hydrolase [Portibacter marinus]|uniref:MBL fold metallo-hydrolase n=1 Tax=Portibacter marinus TaxID=2898660 RepID=UPI001F21A4DF|nr:MBL fold metallo-hydrolase [Portibacter marinus]